MVEKILYALSETRTELCVAAGSAGSLTHRESSLSSSNDLPRDLFYFVPQAASNS